MANDNTINDSTWNKFTQGITTMRDADSSFNKDLTATIQKLNTLHNTKFVLNVEMNQAQKELEKTKLAFDSVSNAENKAAMQTASINYDNLIKNLGYVTDKTKSVEKSMNDMVIVASKADNRVGSMSASGLLKGLATSDLGQMAINTGLNVATTWVGSAFGSNAGNVFNSTVGGTIAGAMAGFAVAGPIGAVVGGGAGGTLGLVNGITEEYKAEDDAYKAKVKSEYDSGQQRESDDLTKSQALSVEREDDQFEIKNLVGGNGDAAQSIMADITDLSSKNPIEYNQLAAVTKTLLHYGLNQTNIKSMLINLSDAGAGLGMSGDGINNLAANLESLKSLKKGEVSEENLSSLKAQNIKVSDYLGKKSLQKLSGDQVLTAILVGLKKDYAGQMAEKAKTVNGLKTILQNVDDANLVVRGDAYNAQMKPELSRQVQYQKKYGNVIKSANLLIGQAEGNLDMTKGSLARKAQIDMFSGKTKLQDGTNFPTAVISGNGSKVKELLILSHVKGNDAFEASKVNQSQEESDRNLYMNIQIEVKQKKENWNSDYLMQQVASKGWVNPPAYNLLSLTNVKTGPALTWPPAKTKNSSATGIFRVPYNNFPALLHEGETVSTAVEARSAKNYPNVTITGNSFVVREEADIDKIARAFVEKLTKISAVAIAS